MQTKALFIIHRLARKIFQMDEVDPVHFLLMDFVSQSCFILPQSENCTDGTRLVLALCLQTLSAKLAFYQTISVSHVVALNLNQKRQLSSNGGKT